MEKRLVEDAMARTWPWVSERPHQAASELPDLLDGATFLKGWGARSDEVMAVRPDVTYPVRPATVFGIEEHVRAMEALAALSDRTPQRLGPLMAASHAGHDAMGLGHPAATHLVEEALARPSVDGARSSGGGCGGTIVIACAAGALDDVAVLIR